MPFSRPALAAINSRIQRDIESKLQGADARLRFSVERVMGAALAGASHGMHGHLDWMSKQIIFDTAEHEYLRRWARVFGLTPKPATPAKGPVTFTGTNGTVVPATSRWRRNDGATFTVDADATITGGSVSAPVTAEVAGAAGNSDEGSSLSAVSPIVGVVSTATVGTDGISDGTDPETDAELLARLLSRVQQPPTGGGPGDYENWALKCAGVTRAWEYPAYLGLGTVGVLFVMDDQEGSIIPDSAAVATVQAFIDSVRPVTAAVSVLAPVADPLNLRALLSPNTTDVQNAVAASYAEVLRRRSKPGGTIYLSDVSDALSAAAGLDNFTILAPAGNTTPAAGHIVVPGTTTWS